MAHAIQDPTYRRLFASQVLSLVGTGLMTVALALLAYRIGGPERAGLVLGGIFTLKMIAYVGFAPLVNSVIERLPVKPVLVALDLARLALTLMMPLITEIWEIYALVFLFQLCSAAFTPAFQSTIPEILPDEHRYATALSLSRMAYNMESMLSPLLAALLLKFIVAAQLFLSTSICFGLSAVCVLTALLPPRARAATLQPFARRLVKGFDIYLRTPRLRGLLAANVALALVVAWVLVDTVAYAGGRFTDVTSAYTGLMASYGLGSIAVALLVPRLLQMASERALMLAGAFALGVLPLLILLPPDLVQSLGLWAMLGGASSLVLTPGGLVLVRSARTSDRPALFAAQFSLSHAGWLIAYPLAGWLGTVVALPHAFVGLGIAASIVALSATRLWPSDDPLERAHSHRNLPHDHRHLRRSPLDSRSGVHVHGFRIDEDHPRWQM